MRNDNADAREVISFHENVPVFMENTLIYRCLQIFHDVRLG